MTTYRQPAEDDYDIVYLEETDKPLPSTLNQNTRYAYFKTIARGGKSVIKSCRDMHLGRVVCYKTLLPEFKDDPVEQQRLLREARVSAMLQHPNTVPTYEIGRDRAGNVYFTMKLVHGYTLREVLDYRERYDLKQLIDVILQVANGLEYAHTHGVVHRDIKPENILVGPFGEILILDWGLAKVWDREGNSVPPLEPGVAVSQAKLDAGLTGQGKLQGTVSYMSPEQIKRDPNIDLRTDIYSFGVVLYELLCGELPHPGEKVHEVTEAVLTQTPAPPSSRARWSIPTLLNNLAMQCLAKLPEERPASCRDIVRILNEDW